MKKILLFHLLILLVIGLVGCNNPTPNDTKSIGSTTTTAPPDNPPAPTPTPELQKYTPYFDFAQEGHSLDSLKESENFKKLPAEWDKDDNAIFREENIPDVLWQWDGMELTAHYDYTSSTRYGSARRQLTRNYTVDGYGTLQYDVESGDWVFLNFSSSSKIDENPPSEKLTQEECRAIAQQRFDNYIATYAPDVDLNTYEFREIERKKLGNHWVYLFVYEKYVDGYLFVYDSVGCGITEYGSLIHFKRGDDYSELEERFDEIDWETINANLTLAAEELLRQNSSMNITYEIVDGYFEKLQDGSFIYRGGFVLYYGGRYSTMVFVIPV